MMTRSEQARRDVERSELLQNVQNGRTREAASSARSEMLRPRSEQARRDVEKRGGRLVAEGLDLAMFKE
jgi:hypothetical protein